MQNDIGQNRWAIAPILQEKLNMVNLPCNTVQDYPARLHAGYCATLQRVEYLARYCTQCFKISCTQHPIASCRQAYTSLDSLGSWESIYILHNHETEKHILNYFKGIQNTIYLPDLVWSLTSELEMARETKLQSF